MKLTNINGAKNIDEYIKIKLEAFSKEKRSLETLYEFMFSEKENIFSEVTDGYRIKKTTYSECKDNIEKRAKVIAKLLKDVPENSIIGLYLANSQEWIELFWAILKAGYKPLLFNDRLGDDILNEVIKTYDVKCVISDDKKLNTNNIYVKDIVYDDNFDYEISNKFADEIFIMSSNTSSNLKICGYSGEQFYYQISDSGTIIQKCKQIRKHYNGYIKLLTFLPFYHIFGLVAVYIWFAFFSRTLVFLKDSNPQTIVNTIRKHEITHIFAVPLFWETIYKTAIKTIKLKGEKTYKKFCKGLKLYNALSGCPALARGFSKIAFKEVRENIFGESIIFLISGGGGISKQTLQFFNAIGYHLVNGYGTTEIGITSVELSAKPKVIMSGAVGAPFKSIQYKISEEGELLVKGNSTAKSIYINGVNVKQSDEEWFNTHDLVTQKKHHYFINGRKDDLIISVTGENINPNLIEPKLRLAGIQNLCLFGQKEKENVYSLLLVEVDQYATNSQVNEIYQQLLLTIEKENLSYAVQRIVFTCSSLITANEFKVNRSKIKKRFESGDIKVRSLTEQTPSVEINEKILKKVKSLFAEALNISSSEIKQTSHFFYDLGGSSLEYFTMITNVQKEFDVAFPTANQAKLATVEQVCTYIIRTKEEK